MRDSVRVVHEGNDVTDSVIDYTREQSICTGIGTLKLTFVIQDGPSFEPWNTIKLYEDDTQRGLYRVESYAKTHDGKFIVECQDESKRLTDYFITENYTIDYLSYAKDWIDKFAAEAKVNVQYKSGIGNGSVINPNTTLGVSSAYDVIMMLLQMSAWYMYFDENGDCIIGDLEKNLGSADESFNEDDIISINRTRHDNNLRNRAVVYGGVDTDGGSWTVADVRRPTPWDRNANDIRTVVWASSAIGSVPIAEDFCNQILDEFAKLTDEKTVVVTGARDVEIGDTIKITSNIWNGKGRLTTLRSSASDSGLITEMVLDEVCPKLLGYYGGGTTYVYTGHDSNGVWRKELTGVIWEDFGTGLGFSPKIKDLIIKNSVFACVNMTDGKAYYRPGDEWIELVPGAIYDADGATWLPTSVWAEACDIDTSDLNIYVIYRLSDVTESLTGYQRSFVISYDPNTGEMLNCEPIFFTGGYGINYSDFKAVDIDKYDAGQRLPTCLGPGSYALFDNPEAIFGTSHSIPLYIPWWNQIVIGPTPNVTDLSVVPLAYPIDSGYGSHVNWENGIGLSFNKNDELKWFNYKKFPEQPYNFSTYKLNDFPQDYWPVGENRGLIRYLYWDGEQDSHFEIIDLYEVGTTHKIYGYNTYTLQEWYESDHKDFAPWLQKHWWVADTPIALSGIQTVDGHTLVGLEAVMVIGQADPAENGAYYCIEWGAWTRIPTWEVSQFQIVQATHGDENIGRCWQLVLENPVEDIVVGQTRLIYKEVFHMLNSTGGVVLDLTGYALGPPNGVGVTKSYPPFGVGPNVHLPYSIYMETDQWEGFTELYHLTITAGGGAGSTLDGRINFMAVKPDTPPGSNVIEKGLTLANPGPFGDGVRWPGTILNISNEKLQISDINGNLLYEHGPACIEGPQLRTGGGTGHYSYLTGYQVGGEYGDTVYRSKFDASALWASKLCEDCPDGSTGHGFYYVYVKMCLHHSLAGGAIPIIIQEIIERPNQEEVLCDARIESYRKIPCCNGKFRIEYNDPAYVEINSNYVTPMIGRWGAIYSYQGLEVRSSWTDQAMFGIANWPADYYRICRQLDDFNGGAYNVEFSPDNRFYGEGPAAGVNIGTLPGRVFVPGLQLFAHGCIHSNRLHEGWGDLLLMAIDKSNFFVGTDLCYLLENIEDQADVETGDHPEYTIRDFDFYKFFTEGSKPEPLISWTVPPCLYTYEDTSGNPVVSGIWPENMKVHKSINNFKGAIISGMFNDGRIMNFQGTSEDGTEYASDFYALMADRSNTSLGLTYGYLGITSVTTVGLTQTTAVTSGIPVFVTLSGIPYSVETTNYGTNPYVFVGLTNPTIFRQKDSGESVTGFEDYLGHPATDIFTIRADDAI